MQYIMTETDLDNMKQEWFKNGYDSGKIDGADESLVEPESRVQWPDGGGIPDPEQTALWTPSITLFDDDGQSIEFTHVPTVHRVQSSGQPEEEASMNKTLPKNLDGTVTMPYEYYQDQLDDVYNRGRKDGTTDVRRTTGRTLAKMVQEIIVDSGGQAPNSLTMAKALLPRLGFQIDGE